MTTPTEEMRKIARALVDDITQADKCFTAALAVLEKAPSSSAGIELLSEAAERLQRALAAVKTIKAGAYHALLVRESSGELPWRVEFSSFDADEVRAVRREFIDKGTRARNICMISGTPAAVEERVEKMNRSNPPDAIAQDLAGRN